MSTLLEVYTNSSQDEPENISVSTIEFDGLISQ